MTDGLRVRRAREEDISELAPLVHLPHERMFERIARDRPHALAMVEADLRGGLVGSAWIAEVDDAVAGAMVVYPHREDAARVRALLLVVLRRSPPWRWPAIARVFWHGARHGSLHPADSLYVDALAVDARFRRRGVALALLEHAASTAAGDGLRSVSLDTAETNVPAVGLYRKAGFEVTQVAPGRSGAPALLTFRRPVGD
ncbi:MAG TPA: GNAT family N-acetyltransferase [Thermoleophilaceae bacterium]|nr:GNAT family N-acetyltransferase [Thermoleophilaceae bacterium]